MLYGGKAWQPSERQKEDTVKEICRKREAERALETLEREITDRDRGEKATNVVCVCVCVCVKENVCCSSAMTSEYK